MTDIKNKILSLKKEKDTVILAHYYQNLDVQDISDAVGDSFALAKLAQAAPQESIILCGVRFMAESAKILSPSKQVYLPVSDAGCPMADMVTSEDVLELKRKYPEAAVVCYVNSSAAVKAVSDICCTSSSAERIVRSLPNKQIIFIPDQNLGDYVARQVPEKEIILFDGYCPIHHRINAEDALRARRLYPNAKILVHPECRREVRDYADFIGSTAGILDYARKSGAGELVIGTENGVIEILQREFPDKKIFSIANSFVCPNMRKTHLEDVLRCLEGETAPLELPQEEMKGARKSLERMVNS